MSFKDSQVSGKSNTNENGYFIYKSILHDIDKITEKTIVVIDGWKYHNYGDHKAKNVITDFEYFDKIEPLLDLVEYDEYFDVLGTVIVIDEDLFIKTWAKFL